MAGHFISALQNKRLYHMHIDDASPRLSHAAQLVFRVKGDVRNMSVFDMF